MRRAAALSKSAMGIKRLASPATSIRQESKALTILFKNSKTPLLRDEGGFTGRVVPKTPAVPESVPAPYVMKPFEAKLNYNGKPWSTVHLEVGHNEIGDAEEADYYIAPDIVEMFRRVELPDLEPVALMPLCHQIPQKLHGLTEPESKRRGNRPRTRQANMRKTFLLSAQTSLASRYSQEQQLG